MPQPRADLIRLYEHTQYRVRLADGGHAVIHVHQTLPNALCRLLPDPDTRWAFISAWNPHSQWLPAAENRPRQRHLLNHLRQLVPTPRIFAAMGIGPADAQGQRWREPSLFVVGITPDQVDALLHRFEQNAAVCGTGHEPATLHWSTTT